MKKKIMVFGTFDGLHPGHLSFFEQARALSRDGFLIVSIARDKNVEKIKRKKPSLNEQARMVLVNECSLVDKVVLGDKDGYITHILKEAPDIIALGYDQEAYTENLKEKLEEAGLAVIVTKLKPFKSEVYKNSLIKKNRSL